MKIIEANIYSGNGRIMDQKYADYFKKKNPENPLVTIYGMDEKHIHKIDKEIQKLPPMMRFTLFEDKSENGKSDVSFFSYTEDYLMNKNNETIKVGPFPTIDIIALLFLNISITQRSFPEYEEIKKKNENIFNFLKEQIDLINEPYIIPCNIKSNNQIIPIINEIKPVDLKDKYNFINDIKAQLKIPNKTFIIMAKEEYLKNKDLPSFALENIKNNTFFDGIEPPNYIDPLIASKAILLEKIREELTEIQNDKLRDSIVKDIKKEETLSLNEILEKVIERKNDWENEIYKTKAEKSLEKSIFEQFKDIKLEKPIIPEIKQEKEIENIEEELEYEIEYDEER